MSVKKGIKNREQIEQRRRSKEFVQYKCLGLRLETETLVRILWFDIENCDLTMQENKRNNEIYSDPLEHDKIDSLPTNLKDCKE